MPVETSAEKYDCADCGKICDKGYVAVKENKYHPDCFKCTKCEKSLGGEPYIAYEGKFFCEDDYHKTVSPTCGHCEEIIRGPYVEAMDKTWHEDHFVCSDCGQQFTENQFHKLDERPYCKPCYTTKTAVDCGKCGKEITDSELFEALDKKYHQGCFVCEFDNHVIGEGEKFSMYSEKVYCQKHLGELLRLNCTVCNDLIRGEYIAVLDQKMHSRCWKCADCACPLTGPNARQHEGRYCCVDCAKKGGGNVAQINAPAPPAAPIAPLGSSIVAPAVTGLTKGVESMSVGGVGARAAGVGAAEGSSLPQGVAMCFTYERLKASAQLPPGVCRTKLESYLSDDEFAKVFGMDKASFAKLPAWRRKQKKQQTNLW